MMARSLGLLLFFAVAAVVTVVVVTSSPEKTDDTKVECPRGFFAIGFSCYYYSGNDLQNARFDSAVAICEAMKPAEGGTVTLAVMGTDYLEYSYVADYIISTGVSRVFVGVTGSGGSGNWTWLDGTPMPLSSSMWGCSDPAAWSCGGFNVDDSQPEGRVYLTTFDCQTASEHYLCEYNPPT